MSERLSVRPCGVGAHREGDHLDEQFGEVVPLGLHVGERLAQLVLVTRVAVLDQLASLVLDRVQLRLLLLLLLVQPLDLVLRARRYYHYFCIVHRIASLLFANEYIYFF